MWSCRLPRTYSGGCTGLSHAGHSHSVARAGQLQGDTPFNPCRRGHSAVAVLHERRQRPLIPARHACFAVQAVHVHQLTAENKNLMIGQHHIKFLKLGLPHTCTALSSAPSRREPAIQSRLITASLTAPAACSACLMTSISAKRLNSIPTAIVTAGATAGGPACCAGLPPAPAGTAPDAGLYSSHRKVHLHNCFLCQCTTATSQCVLSQWLLGPCRQLHLCRCWKPAAVPALLPLPCPLLQGWGCPPVLLPAQVRLLGRCWWPPASGVAAAPPRLRWSPDSAS